MITAYLGAGPSRRGSPIRLIAAALALALAPMSAAAQEPTPPTGTEAPAGELGVDTTIPGLTPAEEPAPAAAAETTEEGAEGEEGPAEDPFSVQHIWQEGDVVARTTLIMMILMSIGSWYIVATKLFDQTRIMGQVKRLGDFWSASSIDEGLDNMGRGNAFRAIAEGAVAAANNTETGIISRIPRSERMSLEVSRELDRLNSRLQGGMAFLATVGATAPFIGLFGTVWGIVNALIAIGLSGDASIERVAGPVGEALIMTAIGLAVAVPAVIFYNLLGRRNKNVSDVARYFAIDVEKLMSQSAKA